MLDLMFSMMNVLFLGQSSLFEMGVDFAAILIDFAAELGGWMNSAVLFSVSIAAVIVGLRILFKLMPG